MNPLQRLLSNTVLAFSSSLIIKASNSLLFILISRQMGPADAGAFNLGITYMTILAALSALGLHEMLVREVAPNRRESGRYLVNYLLIRLALSAGFYALLLAALWLILPYQVETTAVVAILALAVFPEAIFTLCQALFEAHERLTGPLVAALISSGIKLLAAFLIVNRGGDVIQLAWVVPTGSAVAVIVLLPALVRLLRHIPAREQTRLDLAFTWQQLRQTPSFVVIHLVSLFDYQTDTFLISLLAGEAAVGWYGAAQTIMLAFWMMPIAVRAAIYPVMSRYQQLGQADKLSRLYEMVSRYLFLAVLPVAAGISILAEPIIFWIFGPSFAPSVPTLRWLIWALPFALLTVPNARLVLVHHRQRYVSWLLGLGMAANVLLNLLLIPPYGVVGAAVARVVSSAVIFICLYGYVQLRLLRVDVLRFIVRPAVTTAIMAVVVWWLSDLPLLWPVAAGVVVYALASLVLGAVPSRDMVIWRQVFGSSE